MIALLLVWLSCFVGEDPAVLREQALAQESQGNLSAAIERWTQLAPLIPPGGERNELVARVKSLEQRESLRAELVAIARRTPELLQAAGLFEVDENGAQIEGRKLSWQALPLDKLQVAARSAKVSSMARLGLIHERLQRGAPKEQQAALVTLGKAWEASEIESFDAFVAVARVRGEALPAAGYQFVEGRWSVREPSVEAPLPTPASALEQRWQQAQQPLFDKAFLDPYLALQRQYDELERARAHALGLIFDEERYFYPFNPPECPPEKARLFPAVQQEVDLRVASVRKLWKASKRVRLSTAVRNSLQELERLREEARQLRLSVTLDARLPATLEWVSGDDLELSLVNLASSKAQATQRARDRAVRAYHEQILLAEAKALTGNEEREQLRVTNEYRQMLGRPLLAWNSKLQQAARKHSEWMSKSGKFSHFQDEPQTRTPFDRMRLAGYLQGAGENVHMGDSGPEGAHVSWTHSSGHHRQILSARAQEFAAGLSGQYWTQNYGSGAEWESSRPRK